MIVEKVWLPEVKYYCVFHNGPYPKIETAFHKLFQFANKHNLPTENSIGIFYDDPNNTPAEELKSHAGIPVNSDQVLSSPDIEIISIPEGNYFKTTHMGPYSGLFDTWQTFMVETSQSIDEPDYQWTFEIYVNDCESVPENQIQTELYCRIKD